MGRKTGSDPTSRSRSEVNRQNRISGLVFAALCGYVGAAPVMAGDPPRAWAIAGGCTFFLVAAAAPGALTPLTAGLTWLGRQMQRVTTPVALWIFLYLVITPIGIGLRLIGKDVLGLRRDTRRESYWIARTPPGPAPESMRNQF